jgi:drug/metabolite transporter (DMT)-like permease
MGSGRPDPTLAPVAWCLLSAALFGASTPACKALLDGDVAPLTLAGLLYLGAAVATLPFAFGGGQAARRRAPANLRRLAGAVLFGGVLGPVALLWGLASAPAASVALWLNLETTATALLAWALFREHLHARGWLANLAVLACGVLLAAPEGFTVAPAAGWVALACLCWGLDNNLTALIDGYTPAQTTLAKGAVAGSVNLGLGLALGEPLPSMALAAGALGVGALAYGASIVLYIRGAQQLGATRSQMLFATAPFLGTAASWWWLSEPVQTVQLLAGVGMAGALALLLSERHAHVHHHPELEHTHAHRHDDGHHDHVHDDLPADAWHTHAHRHEAVTHRHPHVPDLHHRHEHR